MIPYGDIIGLCHSVAILWEIYVVRHKCHVRWHYSHFKRMLITGQSAYILSNVLVHYINLNNYMLTNTWSISIPVYISLVFYPLLCLMVFQVLIKTYLELPLEIKYIDEQLFISVKYSEVKVFLPTLLKNKISSLLSV